MMPQNEPSRKRPYLLLPPTAIPTDGRMLASAERALSGDATLHLQVALQEAVADSRAVAGRSPVAAGRPVPLALGLLLFVVVPSALGSVAGFHLAGQWTLDPLYGAVAGGIAGLALGGGCLLWNRRKG